MVKHVGRDEAVRELSPAVGEPADVEIPPEWPGRDGFAVRREAYIDPGIL
jgi:hypothetical protein